MVKSENHKFRSLNKISFNVLHIYEKTTQITFFKLSYKISILNYYFSIFTDQIPIPELGILRKKKFDDIPSHEMDIWTDTQF